MKLFSEAHSVRLGWLAGWGFIFLAGFLFLVGFVTSIRQIELPTHYIEPIQMLVYYALFTFFLLGIRGFAVQNTDDDLLKAANTFILLNVLQMVLFYPFSFFRYLEADVFTLLIFALVPVLCVTGISLYRLAERFNKYVPELGGLGSRIVWWNKVAGWMMASIVLIPIGILAALVGEFFLWRLLAKKA